MTASFGPSPNQILTADIEGRMIFWDLRSRLAPIPRGNVPAPGETRSLRCEAGSLQVQANGTQVTISGTASESARVLQLTEEITLLTMSPGNGVVAAVSGKQVHLIGLLNSKHQVLEHEVPVAHVEFSTDGSMLVVAMADKTLERRSARLWNVRTGKPAAPPLVHDDGVLHAAFSPDGARVVTSSEDFSSAIWNARTGEPLGPRLRHGDKVRSAQFATVHDWVVTASDDASAMVWDASTGEPLTMPLMHDRRVMAAVFTENDSALITTDDIGHQWRWNLQPDRKTETEPPSQRPSP